MTTLDFIHHLDTTHPVPGKLRGSVDLGVVGSSPLGVIDELTRGRATVTLTLAPDDQGREVLRIDCEVIGPAYVAAGQLLEQLHGRIKHPSWEQIEQLWSTWADNDRHRECQHMARAPWWPGTQRGLPWVSVNDTMVCVGDLAAAKHPKGLLGRRCEQCGWVYGSGWCTWQIPAAVLAEIRSLIERNQPVAA